MREILKKIVAGLAVVLVGVQFIPTNINKQESIPKTDIRYVYDLPENVIYALETSCYDCHSNNTNYPWYSKVQPIRLLMDKHIREGKEELNFNEFDNYSDRMKRNKKQSIGSQIEEGEMPLPSYLIMHEEAKLSEEEKLALIEFFNKH